jgi:hypothetical protein
MPILLTRLIPACVLMLLLGVGSYLLLVGIGVLPAKALPFMTDNEGRPRSIRGDRVFWAIVAIVVIIILVANNN